MDMNAPANEWGCPWHAYNGYRHDEHYWAYVGANVAAKLAAKPEST